MRKWNVILFLLGVFYGCRGPEGPAGPSGGSNSESLIDPHIQPKIIYTSPAPNSSGPYLDFNGQLTIRFNKIMNKSWLRRALSIHASTGSIVIDTNNVRTVGGDLFTFTPVDSLTSGAISRWRVAQTGTIRISSEAKDI